MITKPSVAPDLRYVLTPQGEAAIDRDVGCICEIRLVNVMVMCVNCGTVYGHVRDGSFGPPKARRFGKWQSS